MIPRKFSRRFGFHEHLKKFGKANNLHENFSRYVGVAESDSPTPTLFKAVWNLNFQVIFENILEHRNDSHLVREYIKPTLSYFYWT